MANHGDPVVLARQLYSRLIDRDFSAPTDDYLELPDTSTGAGEVSDLLKERFTAASATRAIMIRVAGQDVGVSTLAKVNAAAGYAGSGPDFGSAQRSGLPGRSTAYRALVFGCARPGCGEKSYDSFYDERYIPLCPCGHGRMRLVDPAR